MKFNISEFIVFFNFKDLLVFYLLIFFVSLIKTVARVVIESSSDKMGILPVFNILGRFDE